MVQHLGEFYRFLSREFLTLKRIRRFSSLTLLTLGVLAGFLLPNFSIYANAQILNQLSTTQLTALETSTSVGFQFPLVDSDYSISQRFSSVHPGIDLAALAKTPVYPIAEGKVETIRRWPFGFGNHIIVNHGNDLRSLYAHLSTVEVKVGDKVEKNTLIGKVGSTGWTTGNHLHLEIYEKDRALNPLEILSKREKKTESLN